MATANSGLKPFAGLDELLKRKKAKDES